MSLTRAKKFGVTDSRLKTSHVVGDVSTVPPIRAQDPFEDPSSIGNVLLKLGKLSREQLLSAVGQRAHFDEMLLGALLRQLGYVTEFDVAQALKIQADMRRGDPLTAELDVLQAKMDESAVGACALSKQIARMRAANRRHGGPRGGLFLVPPPSVQPHS